MLLLVAEKYALFGNEFEDVEMSVFHLAAKYNAFQVTNQLAQMQDKINIECKTHSQLLTPLHLAVSHGCLEALKTLLAYGANPNNPALRIPCRWHSRITPLESAIERFCCTEIHNYFNAGPKNEQELLNDLKILTTLLECGEISTEDIKAALAQQEMEIKDLEINKKPVSDRQHQLILLLKNSLEQREKGNYPPATKDFLRAKSVHDQNQPIIIDAADYKKHMGTWALLEYAAKSDNLKIFEYAADKLNLERNYFQNQELNILHLAAKNDAINVMGAVLKKAISIDCESSSKHTPLFLAIRAGKLTAVKFLLENGANPMVCINGPYGVYQSPWLAAIERFVSLEIHQAMLNNSKKEKIELNNDLNILTTLLDCGKVSKADIESTLQQNHQEIVDLSNTKKEIPDRLLQLNSLLRAELIGLEILINPETASYFHKLPKDLRILIHYFLRFNGAPDTSPSPSLTKQGEVSATIPALNDGESKQTESSPINKDAKSPRNCCIQ